MDAPRIVAPDIEDGPNIAHGTTIERALQRTSALVHDRKLRFAPAERHGAQRRTCAHGQGIADSCVLEG
jgi:hypothetical protein